MKNLFKLTCALAVAALLTLCIGSAFAQTIIPVSSGLYPDKVDGSKIVLTATNTPEGETVFSWTNTPFSVVWYSTLGREYIGAADTVNACPNTTFYNCGIPASLVKVDPITGAVLPIQYYSAWDKPIHYNNNTCPGVTSMRVKWNDYQPQPNNSAPGCVTVESYAGGNAAMITDGNSYLYYLKLSDNTGRTCKVVFNYALPMLLYSCPGQTIPQAPAEETFPGKKKSNNSNKPNK